MVFGNRFFFRMASRMAPRTTANCDRSLGSSRMIKIFGARHYRSPRLTVQFPSLKQLNARSEAK